MQNDLTTGSVFRNVLSFSLPYLLSYFLQTLYGMADLFIIGQFEGVASTTAVSIGSQVMHMLTVMLVGLAMGATVSIAQAAGGGDKKRTASAIGNTVTLFMLLSLALTALLLALRGGIVSIMSTPEEAVQGTLAYLTVCFIGIPFIAAYNIIASIFRGLGDSKSPMCFIAVACVVNIALDYYFMCTLHLGSRAQRSAPRRVARAVPSLDAVHPRGRLHRRRIFARDYSHRLRLHDRHGKVRH